MENKRRDFLKKTIKASSLVALTPHFNIISSRTQPDYEIIGQADFKYRVHETWGNLDRNVTPVNNCHEMVMDSKGRLIMVGDHIKNNILIYDKSGKLLDAWGNHFKGGHGLSIWNNGEEDFLFICDTEGTVTKTTLEGKELMKIEHPYVYGAYKKEDVFKPTETAIGPNGDIYVADGYGSQYVLQFSKKGEFIRKIGGGQGTKDNQFLTAHGVVIDNRNKKESTLLITSRAENCFKRFTLEGEFIERISLPGAFVCRPVIHKDNLFSGVCWSSDMKYQQGNQSTHPSQNNPDSGFITILNKNNRVVSNPGGMPPKYKGGLLQPMKQESRIFRHCHDVCIDEDDNAYVCQWNANGAYPIKLERV